jgi:hypothetical protein
MNMPPFAREVFTMLIEDLVCLSQDSEAAANTVRMTKNNVVVRSGPKAAEVEALITKCGAKEIRAPNTEEFIKMLETLWNVGKGFMAK